jgi:uncharacterized membrane-anchored protein YitT (DUF2179 family)
MKRIIRKYCSFVFIIISAVLQVFIIKGFILPANLLSSGFTGLAILLNKILGTFDIELSISIIVLVLNLPVAVLCAKGISKKFTFLSVMQIVLLSFLLKVVHVEPFFEDILLNIAFGGFAYGMSIVLALKGGGSTGGTDFIALYFSNKLNKSLWNYVFVFNTVILLIFGCLFSFEAAGYSILFQFISTRTIESFYRRYEKVTLQITTRKPDEIIEAYIQSYRHGISKVKSVGGYSKEEMALLYSVVSTYEVNDIVSLLRTVDGDAIVNVIRTDEFIGGFFLNPDLY